MKDNNCCYNARRCVMDDEARQDIEFLKQTSMLKGIDFNGLNKYVYIDEHELYINYWEHSFIEIWHKLLTNC